jgi:hypothetical protein
MKSIVENYHKDAIESFRGYKKLAERAMEQISDEEFFRQIDPESNSIAIIVKHIAGNLHSRWRDFLMTDGEKASRKRDSEFEIIEDTRETLLDFWESGWQTLFDALELLKTDDFTKTVTIRGEPHTIVEAINRQLTHYSYHVGQLIFLAKHLRADNWSTLSVPRNRSAEFNAYLKARQEAGHEKANRLETPAEFAEKSRRKS